MPIEVAVNVAYSYPASGVVNWCHPFGKRDNV